MPQVSRDKSVSPPFSLFGVSGHKYRAMGEQYEEEGGLQSMTHNKWLREWHRLPLKVFQKRSVFQAATARRTAVH